MKAKEHVFSEGGIDRADGSEIWGAARTNGKYQWREHVSRCVDAQGMGSRCKRVQMMDTLKRNGHGLRIVVMQRCSWSSRGSRSSIKARNMDCEFR